MRPISGLALMHLAANAILLGLAYYWLGVPESRAATLVWSALIAIVILLFACWTYGSGFTFFAQADQRRAVAAWRSALRNIIPFALAVVVIAVLYWLLARWGDYSAKPSFRIA